MTYIEKLADSFESDGEYTIFLPQSEILVIQNDLANMKFTHYNALSVPINKKRLEVGAISVAIKGKTFHLIENSKSQLFAELIIGK